MRSLSLGVFCGLVFLSLSAQARVKAETIYRVYDDGETRVESPKLDVSSKFMQDRATVRVGYAADIVTSSSSDVKSYGTRDKISDYRKEYDGTFSMELQDGSVGWTFINSTENDYRSNTIAFAGSRDFFEKNTTLFMSFAFGEDRIGRSTDKIDEYKAMTNQTYSLGLTQVFSKKSVGQLLYDFRVENGYMASPYRRARQKNADGTLRLLPENHPLTRNRNSIALKYNQYLDGPAISLASTLRTYFDSWGVLSGTLEERVGRRFGDRFDLALNLRFYYQKEASFYQDKYDDLGAFYTGNKTLANYTSLLVGIRPTYLILERLSAFAKAEYYTIDYKNHTNIGVASNLNDDKMLQVKAMVYGLGIEGEF